MEAPRAASVHVVTADDIADEEIDGSYGANNNYYNLRPKRESEIERVP